MKAYRLEQGAAPLEGECPLCGCRIEPPESVVECPECRTSYHLDCWHFCGDRCGRLGCAGEANVTGVIPLPVAAARPAARSTLLRISPSEIARTVTRTSASPRPANHANPLPWVWRGSVRSALFAMTMSLLAAAFYFLVINLVRRSLGEQGLASHFGLPFLQGIGAWASSHWALGGLIYGLLYHRHLTLRSSSWQNAARVVLSALYLAPLAFALGHLAFAPARWGADLLWGLPAKVLWLSPIAAWGLLVLVVLSILGTFQGPINLFVQTFGVTVAVVAAAVSAYIRMTTSGLFFGGLLWLLGAAVDLVWRGRDFSSAFGSWGLAVGGCLGFVTGAASALHKMAKGSVP